MTDRELFEKALEALEEISGGYSQNLIVALRERLAQPEQPSVPWSAALESVWGEPEQEPVAVARVDDLERGGRVRALAMGLGLDQPLYTTPPQRKPEAEIYKREWVGLTDEDKQTAVWTNGTFGAGALWAEAKLKEKNNG